jgi:hypothetical protein
VLIARVWLNGHAYSISGYTFLLHDDASPPLRRDPDCGADLDNKCSGGIKIVNILTFRQSTFIVVQSTYITLYRADV